MNRDHSVIFEIASKYCILDSFVDYNGYSISSKAFLPTVVDTMLIWVIKRWQQYTEELYKRKLHGPDSQDGVITYLEPDILECEVKWALGSITTKKASGGDGIPVELFQILKDDAVKVLHALCQQIWTTRQWPQDWKNVSFHSNLKERQCQRKFNYHIIALISHSSK